MLTGNSKKKVKKKYLKWVQPICLAETTKEDPRAFKQFRRI